MNDVPTVPVVLDKPRNVRLTTRALMNAELRLSEIYKRPVAIGALLAEVVTSKSIATTVLVVLLHQGLLHQGLLHEDPKLTEDQVADSIGGFLDQAEIAVAILQALTRQQPTAAPADAPAS